MRPLNEVLDEIIFKINEISLKLEDIWVYNENCSSDNQKKEKEKVGVEKETTKNKKKEK